MAFPFGFVISASRLQHCGLNSSIRVFASAALALQLQLQNFTLAAWASPLGLWGVTLRSRLRLRKLRSDGICFVSSDLRLRPCGLGFTDAAGTFSETALRAIILALLLVLIVVFHFVLSALRLLSSALFLQPSGFGFAASALRPQLCGFNFAASPSHVRLDGFEFVASIPRLRLES